MEIRKWFRKSESGNWNLPFSILCFLKLFSIFFLTIFNDFKSLPTSLYGKGGENQWPE